MSGAQDIKAQPAEILQLLPSRNKVSRKIEQKLREGGKDVLTEEKQTARTRLTYFRELELVLPSAKKRNT